MLGANPNTTESYSRVGWPIAPNRSQPTADPTLQPVKDILRVYIFPQNLLILWGGETSSPGTETVVDNVTANV